MKISKDKLAKLLNQAKQAHHEYITEQNIENDESWATWYAEFIHQHVSKD